MAMWVRLRSMLRNLFQPSRIDRSLDDELRGYVDLLTDEKIAAGLSPAAARRQALVELGGAEQVKERVREVRAGVLVEQLAQDVRYALRALRRAPGFTAVAVVTLALGIGANTAIFSIVDALLFRPLPIADPHRVVALYRGASGSNHAFSYLDYLDYRTRLEHFEGFAAWGGIRLWFRNGGDLERVDVAMVTGDYFDVLGIDAAAGRVFVIDDDDFSAPRPVAVISDRLWRTRFGGDPAVVGRTCTFGGQIFTIVGVAPAGFAGLDVGAPADVWIPLAAVPFLEPSWNIRDRREIWLSIVGRLRTGSAVTEARASLEPVAAQIARELPGDGDATVRLVPAGTSVSDPAARAGSIRLATLLMSIVGFVLLVACANVANLVLVRGAARGRELGVRLAIGATRSRVARQVVTESVVLAVAGGLAALVVANWTAALLRAVAPATVIPAGLDSSLDGRVLAFAAALSLVSGVAFGAVPAWQLARVDLLSAIKGGRPDAAAGPGSRLRRVTVVAQVALSAVLVVGASLFVRTLAAAAAVHSGYDTSRVLLVTIDFAAAKTPPDVWLALARRVTQRVRAVPGIESASLGQVVPLSGSLIQRPATPEGIPARDGDVVPYSVVGDDYFRTLGMSLRGRDFRGSDDEAAPRVVIVNESLAKALWPGQNVIGKRLQLPLRDPGPAYEVIGVVSDGKYVSLTEAQQPFLYLPLAQNPRPRLTLHVRTAGTPSVFVAQVRAALRDVAPDLPVYNPTPLDEQVARSLGRERLIARLLTAFSGVALLIAAVGLYGMLSYAVARRTRELGVRMALGARPADLMWMVVRQSATLVSVGLASGLVAAVLLARLVTALLFGVTPADPVALVTAVVTLSSIAGIATCVPARRVTRIDPLRALRSE